MKLRFDPVFFEWFSCWPGEFEWDGGNLHKNEKHGILASEIEMIFDSPVYVAGRIAEADDEGRWLLLGETGAKGWALVVTTRGERLRVISCRRQREKEAESYEEFKKE